MPVHNTMSSTVRNSASVCLLLALLVGLYLKMYDDVSKDEEISTDEKTTRPEAITPQGIVRGINMVTRRNRTIFGFMGIPFAKPPVGNLRFRAPVPADPWNGTLDASKSSDPCPQPDDEEFIGNEDCLYLNVYTPKLPTDENSTLLPVMIFIIGGAYKTGSNIPTQHGPDFLLDKDVILVVPNSRLGPLGYLSTGDEVSPGNYGLKDMVQALRWNQDNIRYFGGDPNQVTLFGGSSGAASVHLLLLANSTNGLFHRYITQSGSALVSVFEAPREMYANLATQLGEYLGCPTNTSRVLVDCLRRVDASQLVDTIPLVRKWKTIPNIMWIPTIEPDVEGALVIDSPQNLVATGKVRDLPWLSSVNSGEMTRPFIQFYTTPNLLEEFLDEIDSALPFLLGYENSVENVTAYTNTLKSYYLNDLTANRSLLLTNLTNLMSDALFNYPAYQGIKQQLILAENPRYFCSFGYRGTLSVSWEYAGGANEYTGVAHGDERIYLFHNRDTAYGPPEYVRSDTDWIMVDTMVQLWTSFAISGTPTTVGLNSTAIWEPFSSRNNYLRIGNGSDLALEMEYDFLKERMDFWDELTAATFKK